MQGNTSEIQLTVEVTQFLHERPDVQRIVLVTGDRPYLPLVRTIREEGRRALVASVNPPRSDRYMESNVYLDARNLLSRDSREDLLANAPDGQGYDASQPASNKRYESLNNPAARRAIEITEEHFGQYEEVYLTPLLRKLSDTMGPDQDPKALVSELEAAGAVRLEKRSGYPYDYTVLIVHDDHPDVRAVQNGERVSANASPTSHDDEEESESTDSSSDSVEESYDYDEYAIDEALSAASEDTAAPDTEPAVSTASADGAPPEDDGSLDASDENQS